MKELIKYLLLWLTVLTIIFACTKYNNRADSYEIQHPQINNELAEQICREEGI